jgi:hypothetical protein
MSIKIVLTHTRSLSLASEQSLKEKGVDLIHKPCVRIKENTNIPQCQHMTGVILSSMTAIDCFLQQNLFVQEYYCIGNQTAAYLLQKRPGSKIFSLQNEPYNLRRLLEYYQEKIRSTSVLWVGSFQGLLKHRQFLIDHYPSVKVHITHWNWPVYFINDHASNFFQDVDFVVCSSISAALAISQLQWNCSAEVLLSSRRLQKYFRHWNKKPRICQHHWLEEISYN